MERVSSVSEGTRSTVIDFNSHAEKKRKPAGGDGGLSQQEDFGRVSEPAVDFCAAISIVAQAREVVTALINAHKKLAEIAITGGNAFASAAVIKGDLQTLYGVAFDILEAAHPSGAGPDFEAIFGVRFGDLERALEGIGWLIAEPETRAKIGSSVNLMITRQGVASNA